MTNSLSIATCAIYSVFVIPVLYLLIRHGRFGLLGWLFLFLFCTLRIIGGALAIHDAGAAANIISSVGLSPLLLATAGLLHEGREFRIQHLDKKMEWVSALAYHMLVVAGVALTAAGSAKLQAHQEPIDKADKMVKAGISILTVAWVALVGWTGLSFHAPRGRNSQLAAAGTVLLAAVVFALSFIGLRVIYTLVALCTQKPSLNPVTGSLAIRVVLSFLPEVIATLAFILSGFQTIRAPQLARLSQEDNSSLSPKRRAQPWI
ncbi:hypothetical protein PDE_02115 [Penicillium oxalicum 114-2]|uniref:DUF7702 domain-containing protein n=1 Tax=Penicillium oxalicum (strain 114-2 / CGMCC 5302) TaxID=933388 RepID=S8AYW1_PENO1|nr:hypothetical protein PDE_02115 [Penicillium oxalicum 114-2]